VRLYEVYKNGECIAYYLLDAFYREEKRSGAWADNIRPKYQKKLPFVINVCNFPKDSECSLLSLRDVETLFHEF
jgi:Zn-dependent oligopeptidase